MNTELKPALPLVGVSHCLLGANVRYNAETKKSSIVEMLSVHVEWLTVCPEVAAGMSVPRPPIELVQLEEGIRALGVSDRALDPTEAIEAYANEVLKSHPSLSGFVLKARSPSCGLKVSIHNERGEETGNTAEGVFVRILRERLPKLPVIDEEALADEALRESFIAEVGRYF